MSEVFVEVTSEDGTVWIVADTVHAVASSTSSCSSPRDALDDAPSPPSPPRRRFLLMVASFAIVAGACVLVHYRPEPAAPPRWPRVLASASLGAAVGVPGVPGLVDNVVVGLMAALFAW